MSDPISVLERLGCEPYLDPVEASALAELLDPAVRDALQACEDRALAVLLGRPAAMACAISAPDNDEPAPTDLPVEDDPESPDIPGDPD